jgi:hypothetical protein
VARTGDRILVRGWLTALQPPSPEHPPDEVHRTVEEVLSRQEYLDAQPSLLQRAWAWLVEQFFRLVGELLASNAGSWLGLAIFVVVLLALVGLAIWLARGLSRDPARQAGTHDEPGRGPEAWLADAERLESEGDWRQGLRCRYRALVATLDDRGVVEEVPGTTTGAYRRQVSDAAPGAAGAFAAATELFEHAWYGNRPIGAAESHRFIALDAEVRVEAGGSAQLAGAATGTRTPR